MLTVVSTLSRFSSVRLVSVGDIEKRIITLYLLLYTRTSRLVTESVELLCKIPDSVPVV